MMGGFFELVATKLSLDAETPIVQNMPDWFQCWTKPRENVAVDGFGSKNRMSLNFPSC